MFSPSRSCASVEDLVALERAVGLDLDLAELVIGILEEEALRAEPDAEESTDAERQHKRRSWKDRTRMRRLRCRVALCERTLTSRRCCWRRWRVLETRSIAWAQPLVLHLHLDASRFA